MILRTLRLGYFRNHISSTFAFGAGINVFLGDNGHGKTNILEAISYLCLTKSFFAASDALVLNIGAGMFEVEGTLTLEHGADAAVRVAYAGETREKVFSVNKRRMEPFSAVIGKFPIVICSPEHAPITSGGPAERRRFIDFVVSQSNTAYVRELIEYRKILKHRGKVLLDARIARRDPGELLVPWDEKLIELGSALMVKRSAFLMEFREFIAAAYRRLVETDESPEIAYDPNVPAGEKRSEADVRAVFQRELARVRSEEIRFGTTLAGPHRDELRFRLNGLDLRSFASQGQHKTFLVALKIGEFYYLKQRCGETPLLLLDDVFSELDEQRAHRLLLLSGELSQTFITSTNSRLVDELEHSAGELKKFTIRQGTVVDHEAAVSA